MTKAPFNILKFIFTLTIGAVYGMLFAQKPGKQLRKELKDSPAPLAHLFKEGVAVDTEAINALVGEVQKSEHIQKAMTQINGYVYELGVQAEKFGKDGIQKAQKEMETLAFNAKKMADHLQVKFETAKKEMGKITTDEINKFKHPSSSEEV